MLKVNIEFDPSSAEDRAAVVNLVAVMGGADAVSATAAGKPGKDKTEKVEKAKPIEKPEPEKAKAITLKDLTDVVTAHIAAKGRDATVAVFEKFGVKKASALDESRWPELVAALSTSTDDESMV